MNDLISWLRHQLDTDEQWARAASEPYRHADEGSRAPETGVHWRWVTGDQWETTTPDPVVSEFVDGPGEACWLATVEEWPVTHGLTDGTPLVTRMTPKSYANEIVEMDSAAAGHIIRHDPARVLRQVQAHRAILDRYEFARSHPTSLVSSFVRGQDNGFWQGLEEAVKELVSIYSDRDGYKEEWSV